jgi:hypothetical protein
MEQGFRGRPAFNIASETLEYFLENNFKVGEISTMLGVSKRTIERRLKDLGLSVASTYSKIDDQELEEKVRRIILDFPAVGYRTVSSMLMSEGHRLQEYRIRRAVKVVDPEGVLFRRLFLTTCRIHRRQYFVSGPLALWHIDGNHKLIRYGMFVIVYAVISTVH